MRAFINSPLFISPVSGFNVLNNPFSKFYNKVKGALIKLKKKKNLYKDGHSCDSASVLTLNLYQLVGKGKNSII